MTNENKLEMTYENKLEIIQAVCERVKEFIRQAEQSSIINRGALDYRFICFRSVDAIHQIITTQRYVEVGTLSDILFEEEPKRMIGFKLD
jgi:transcriptional regulator CtsR